MILYILHLALSDLSIMHPAYNITATMHWYSLCNHCALRRLALVTLTPGALFCMVVLLLASEGLQVKKVCSVCDQVRSLLLTSI